MNVPDDKIPSVLSPTVAAANGKHVVALSISGHVGPEDGPILGKLLSLMPNLVDLSFMLGLDPSRLPTLQQAPPGVRKLSLNYNSLSEKDTNNIIGLLAHFANTEIFSLSGNQWGSASLDGLVNALTQSGSCVRELEFAGMGLTNAASPVLGRLLALPKLEVLDIRNNKLTSLRHCVGGRSATAHHPSVAIEDVQAEVRRSRDQGLGAGSGRFRREVRRHEAGARYELERLEGRPTATGHEHRISM